MPNGVGHAARPHVAVPGTKVRQSRRGCQQGRKEDENLVNSGETSQEGKFAERHDRKGDLHGGVRLRHEQRTHLDRMTQHRCENDRAKDDDVATDHQRNQPQRQFAEIAEHDIGRYEERLVREWIEIGAEFAVLAEPTSDETVHAIGDAGDDEGKERDEPFSGKETPKDERNEEQASDRDDVRHRHASLGFVGPFRCSHHVAIAKVAAKGFAVGWRLPLLRTRVAGANAPHMTATENERAGEGSLTYADAGVDTGRGTEMVDRIRGHVASTRRSGADGSIGGFGGLFDLAAAGYRDPLLVAATDGVGTKLRVAIEADRHETVGIDLVAMCVNDLIVQGAEPLFFLDYLASGRLRGDRDERLVAGIAEGCRQSGCALIGGETAEMPGMYTDADYDLAGFAVGAVERELLLPRGVAEGDLLLGLRSSGLHSNGFSLVRRVVERAGMNVASPAPFAERSLGEELLEPTRLYVRSVLDLLSDGDLAPNVHALAHITGGGLPENLPRVLPEGLAARIDLAAINVPSVFGWLARTGPIAHDELLHAFNCGVGMVVVVAAEAAESIVERLRANGEQVGTIGAIESGGDPVSFSRSLRL